MEMFASTVYGYVDGVGRDGEKGGHQVGKKTVDLGGDRWAEREGLDLEGKGRARD